MKDKVTVIMNSEPALCYMRLLRQELHEQMYSLMHNLEGNLGGTGT